MSSNPPHVWVRWLPSEYRERGPKVVRRGTRDIDYVGTASYVEHFDDEVADQGRLLDLRRPRLHAQAMVAAVGYPKEEMTLTPITYDDMRPGCYDPTARSRTWT